MVSQSIPEQRAPLTPQDAALIAETCVRSDIIWIKGADADRHQAAWHVWYDDAVCVLFGVGEQMLPLLAGEVEVIARSKDTGARLVRFVATAEQLPASGPAWQGATAVLAGKRLNAEDPAGQRSRWASGVIVTLLRPTSLLASGGGDDDTPSGAAPPPGGPATTIGRTPFHLGGRRRRFRSPR
jgi:hypothetical protein